jgi:predicted DNA-binding transcriptional regulator AlpA
MVADGLPESIECWDLFVLKINEFCARYRISRRTFYRLRRVGRAPDTIKVGRTVMIEDDAIQEWLRVCRGITPQEDRGPI